MSSSTAREAYRQMKELLVDPPLASEGFYRRGDMWIRNNENEDVVVVRLQRRQGSDDEPLYFVAEYGVSPKPYRDWLREVLREPGAIDIANCVFRDRFDRLAAVAGMSSTDVWWDIQDDQTAHAAGVELAQGLQADVVPTLERLLPRGALVEACWRRRHPSLKRLNDGLLPGILLADSGPNSALDKALSLLDQDTRFSATAAWIRERPGSS